MAADLATDADQTLLRNLAEVRAIVEPAAARLAADRRTDADLSALEAALEAMGERGADPGQAVAADLAFHRALLSATHNELLQRMGRWSSSRASPTATASCTAIRTPGIPYRPTTPSWTPYASRTRRPRRPRCAPCSPRPGATWTGSVLHPRPVHRHHGIRRPSRPHPHRTARLPLRPGRARPARPLPARHPAHDHGWAHPPVPRSRLTPGPDLARRSALDHRPVARTPGAAPGPARARRRPARVPASGEAGRRLTLTAAQRCPSPPGTDRRVFPPPQRRSTGRGPDSRAGHSPPGRDRARR
ncbi:hypothetical protein ABIE67_008863 [Streptomyces sp. V4I8]